MQAVAFIRQYHYSKVMPRLNKYFVGFFVGGQLSGVVVLGWGTQPLQTIRKLFPRHDLKTMDYIEIGKMCFLPDFNSTKYFGSLVISQLVKWLRRNTDFLYLYTLADGIMGKCGYVYRQAIFSMWGASPPAFTEIGPPGKRYTPGSAGFCWKKRAFDGVENALADPRLLPVQRD